MTDSPVPRIRAFGDELIAIHDALRERLDRIRQGAGAGVVPAREARRLVEHCLAFCGALTAHHTGEDRGAFPALAQQAPELAPVLKQLEEDHHLISIILAGVERLVDGLPAEPTAAQLRAFQMELDGLGAIMESHFAFEERRIVAALNAFGDDSPTALQLFGIEPNSSGGPGLRTD